MSNNIAVFDEKMGIYKGIFAFTGLGELWECENWIMHDFQSWKMVSELKKAWEIAKIDIFRVNCAKAILLNSLQGRLRRPTLALRVWRGIQGGKRHSRREIFGLVKWGIQGGELSDQKNDAFKEGNFWFGIFQKILVWKKFQKFSKIFFLKF